MQTKVRSWAASLFLGFLALAAAGTGAAAHHYWPTSPVTRGVILGDRLVPASGLDVEAWLSARAEEARARTVRFYFEGQTFEATFEQAGLSVDAEAMLGEARRVGHTGGFWKRLRDAERARKGLVEIPWAWKLDEGKARALLATFAPAVAQAPVDARIDLTAHTRIPEEFGRELDVEASLAQLKKGSNEDEMGIPLLTHRVAAKVTLGELTYVNIEKVLSSWETTFSLFGTGAHRAVNIKNAGKRLDGLVIAPGAMISFNDVVGPRTRERGFALAPEIQGDEMQLGYGGGTCQMSTTLFAAALFGALDIIERQSHSRPSHYAQMGLDATVSYPLADLKIRNNMTFPILIHAFSPKPTAVRVELLGGDPVAKVDYTYGVGNTEDFVRRVQVKPGLPAGQRVLHQKGIPGYEVTSIVRLHYFDGREDEHHYFSGYRPAPEIYWVAPGYDMSELPPLPEHAKGVEGDTAPTQPASYSGLGG